MRIGLDVRPLLDTQPGGVGAYTRSLLEAMLTLPGQEIVPVTTGRRIPDLGEDAPAVARVRFPNPLVNASLAFFHEPRLDRVADADRYLLPNWNFLALDRATELTLVVHDLSFERNPGWFSPRQRLWHSLVAPRRLVERADRLVAVSEWTKRDLASVYGVPADRIAVIHPVPDRPPADLPFPLELPERFVLFLGAVEERKNPAGLVEAFAHIAAKHPDAHLVIAGKPGYGSGRVRDLARRSGVLERIRFLGYVPLAVRRSLLCHATAFAYPSFYEGFGIPLLDAMAAGLPVVAGNGSAMPEVVGDAGLLVDPGDVGQIAEALDAVLADRSFARLLGAKARERARRFPETMVPALAPLFG